MLLHLTKKDLDNIYFVISFINHNSLEIDNLVTEIKKLLSKDKLTYDISISCSLIEQIFNFFNEFFEKFEICNENLVHTSFKISSIIEDIKKGKINEIS